TTTGVGLPPAPPQPPDPDRPGRHFLPPPASRRLGSPGRGRTAPSAGSAERGAPEPAAPAGAGAGPDGGRLDQWKSRDGGITRALRGWPPRPSPRRNSSPRACGGCNVSPDRRINASLRSVTEVATIWVTPPPRWT